MARRLHPRSGLWRKETQALHRSDEACPQIQLSVEMIRHVCRTCSTWRTIEKGQSIASSVDVKGQTGWREQGRDTTQQSQTLVALFVAACHPAAAIPTQRMVSGQSRLPSQKQGLEWFDPSAATLPLCQERERTEVDDRTSSA